MRTNQVETYSLKDLAKQGYKERADGSQWYIGNSKWPTSTIRKDIEHLLGRKFKLVGFNDRGRPEVEDELGNTFLLPPQIVKTKIAKQKVHRKIVKSDHVAKFNGYSFDFDCSMRNMSRAEAIDVARWVLRVTGGRP